jgi:hypothetical protein
MKPVINLDIRPMGEGKWYITNAAGGQRFVIDDELKQLFDSGTKEQWKEYASTHPDMIQILMTSCFLEPEEDDEIGEDGMQFWPG